MSNATRQKAERNPGGAKRAPRDPLGWHMPHTPRLPFKADSIRKTCSRKTANNMGCEFYSMCGLRSQDGRHIKEMAGDGVGIGPAQIVVEDHRDVAIGDGRRFAKWCFSAIRMYFGENPKAGFSVVHSRVFEQDGKPVQMPAYEAQGPYYYALQSEAKDPAEIDRRKAFEAQVTGHGHRED